MCAFLRQEQRDFYVCVYVCVCVCVCGGGGGVIVPGAPEGSTGRLIIFVVAFGEACAYLLLQYMTDLFLRSEISCLHGVLNRFIRKFGH